MTDRWSYSKLSCYTACPQRYAFKYGEPRRVEPPTQAAIRGSIFHSWPEAYARHCHEAGDRRTDYDEGRKLASSYPPEVRELAEQFLAQVEFDWSLILSRGDSIEREFEVALPDDYGSLRGRVDLVQWNEGDKELWVTDWKSGWGGEKPERCPPQLECYAWAIAQEFEQAERVSAYAHFVGNGVTHDWAFWRDELTPNWALSVIDRIRADEEFRATPGQACEFCGYTNVCPLFTADPIVHPTGLGTAETAYEQIIAAKARIAKITDGLKVFFKDREPLVFEDGSTKPPGVGHGLPNGDALEIREGTSVEEVLGLLRETGEDTKGLWALVSPSKLPKPKDGEPEEFLEALRGLGYSDEQVRKLIDAGKLATKVAQAQSAGFGDNPAADRLREVTHDKPLGNRFAIR